MLIEYTIGNFRSFDKPQTFSMVAGDNGKFRDSVVTLQAGLSLLNFTGIYGPNASGKSNLFESLRFLRRMVISSFQNQDPLAKLPVSRFALHKRSNQAELPALFDISFTVGQAIYTYHVELTPTRIVQERLSIDDVNVFERSNQIFKINGRRIHEAETKKKLTRPNTLFISVLAATNTKVGLDVMRFFRNELVVINGLATRLGPATKDILKGRQKNDLLRRLQEVDLAINNLTVKQAALSVRDLNDTEIPLERVPASIRADMESDATRIHSLHTVYDDDGQSVGQHEFDFESVESNGTKRFLSVVAVLQDALGNGKIVLADEFGAAMHTLMIKYLIHMFDNDQNKHGAQLIFNTQDIQTMDNETLRTDQIWFAEKSMREATRLISLADFQYNGKPIRSDRVFRRSYLKGQFGAIPLINDHVEVKHNGE